MSAAEAQNHPLSPPDLSAARHPRRGGTLEPSTPRPITSYFDLKNQSDARAAGIARDTTPTAPAEAAEVPHDVQPLVNLDSIDVVWAHEQASKPLELSSKDVLSTPWHQLSDDDIDKTLGPSPHVFHETLRVMSRALDDLTSQLAQLEALRQRETGKEARARKRAKQAMWDMEPSERDIAQKILEIIFDDEGEEAAPVLPVETVNSLPDSLSEAMADNFTLVHPPPSIVESPPVSESPPSGSTTPASTVASRRTSATDQSSIAASEKEKNRLSGWVGNWWTARGRVTSNPSSVHRPETHTTSSEPVLPSSVPDVSVSHPPEDDAPTRRPSTTKGVMNILGLSSSPAKSKKRGLSISSAISSHSTSASLPFLHSIKSPAGMSPIMDYLQEQEQPRASTDTQSLSSSSVTLSSIIVHPPHIRAIFHATRVLVADQPSSILVDQAQSTSPLVSRLALDLVRNARDQGLDITKTSAPRSGSTAPAALAVSPQPNVTLISGSSSSATATASLGKALAVTPTRPSAVATLSRQTLMNISPLSLPKFSSPSLGRRKESSVPNSAKLSSPSVSSGSTAPPQNPPTSGTPTRRPPGTGTVELESIVPQISRPPTLFASRQMHGSSLSSPDFRPLLPYAQQSTATRFSSAEQPLTDRYGFIYDISQYDVNLLIKAKEANNTAPASLTGLKIADRDTNDDGSWSDDDDEFSSSGPATKSSMTVVNGPCDCCGGDPSSHTDRHEVNDLTAADEVVLANTYTPSSPVSPSSISVRSRRSSRGGRNRSATLVSSIMSLPPPKPSVSDAAPVNSSRTATATAPSSGWPTHACGSTVRLLLSQLTEMHDKQQAVQKAEWDVFLAKRRRRTVQTVTKNTITLGGAAALLGIPRTGVDDEEVTRSAEGFVGLGQMNKDDWKEFSRLVHSGIPLVYRAKVWSEASGASELAEPGVFQELLSAHEGEQNTCLDEIEKDVRRTMPTNTFYGGDGVGVGKLRRVLQAYSWRNPEVGYCQGMNLVASTLLLVHADEDDAFWALTSIIEKILPPEFFSPSLLVSRACPLVLLDFVQDLQPKLYAHLAEIGVDLGAICFSWFLSLFTDCLPVETLFRVWDVLFLEGMDVLFRVALAMLRINEPELLQCDSVSSLYIHLESMTTRMWHPDKLLKVQSELKSSITHADLVKRRQAHVAALKDLM